MSSCISQNEVWFKTIDNLTTAVSVWMMLFALVHVAIFLMLIMPSRRHQCLCLDIEHGGLLHRCTEGRDDAVNKLATPGIFIRWR